ncbi:MAG: Gfo/Idh/MocA family oxidoreductase [Kiritimatiellae bacterium]|nr:Gfo/Idh/MocA family oxidoreductase [Kiritimatiellia bacterium]
MSEVFESPEAALTYVKTTPPAQGATMMGVPFERRDVVRVGMIGVGGRGSGLLRNLLAVEGARITAVSDIAAAAIAAARERVESAGQPSPAIEPDWKRLCERKDVDLIYVCTPWACHVPQALRAMECGKHVAVEVPAATKLADCWRLVDTSERTRRHCVMLENCCYGQTELLVLNMIRAGLLGTITHGEAAYIHELRALLMSDHGGWRRAQYLTHNGNFYPTHGLGPVAWYMGIHRGDRFARLVSMSSSAAGLTEYRDRHLPEHDPKRREKYVGGDMNTSIIQTERGRTIVLQYDLVTPRPYSRINLVQGTRGAFCDYPPRLYLDGQETHDWQPLDASLKAKHEHPLWRQHGEQATKLDGGHGGMDFIMNHRLIQTFRQGLPPDMDVYDAAAWSAPGPLSTISVAWQALALPFPDFTRGQWAKVNYE